MLSFLASLRDPLNTYKKAVRLYSYISEMTESPTMEKKRIAPLLATGE
jgi:hypothetical protein